MADDDEGVKSIFNEAALKMKRIDASQRNVNEMWLIPLNYIVEKNKYGYEIIASELLNLLGEVWGKLTEGKGDKRSSKYVKGEKDIAKEHRMKILDFLEQKTIFMVVQSNGYSGKRVGSVVNRDNWNELRELMFDFQMLLKEYYEIHEISAPNREEEGGWD